MKQLRIVLVALLALLAITGASAQSRVTLTVVASEGPAQVILNGRLLGTANPSFSASVTPGTYELIVRKAGLPEFKQTIVVGSAGLTVNATFGSTVIVTPPPASANHKLTVQSNVVGADVYINGVLAGKAPFTGQVPAGSYTIVVKAPGYKDFTQGVRISGDAVINAILEGGSVLQVNANVPGAQVYLNGSLVGTVPYSASMPGGTYTVVVKAPGYSDFTQTIVLRDSAVVSATLSPSMVQLNLGNLFPGAEIFLNGLKVGVAPSSGPFITQVAPGTYTLTIRAAGFLEFTVQITVGPSGYSYTPVLQPLMAKYTFNLPEAMLNPSYTRNPWSQIRLYIDDKPQKTYQGELTAGKHTIKVISGAFQIVFTHDFVAGKSYVLEPFMGITVKD